MRFCVLVNLQRHYDPDERRFNDLAFKASSGDNPGASIINMECGIEATGSICAHISKHYPGVGGDPAVFWEFDSGLIPSQCRIEQVDSDTGDKCHHEIKGVSKTSLNRVLRDLRKTWDIGQLSICDPLCGSPDGFRPLKPSDVPSS